MRRGNLFFIGVISAVATIISLNVALGRSGYYNERYPFYNRYHHCNFSHDNRFRDEKKSNQESKRRLDSTNSNY